MAQKRPAGLRLIIAYKVVKAPLMLALGVALLIDGHQTLHFAQRLAFELSEGGRLLGRVAHFIRAHANLSVARKAAVACLFDGVTTAFEGFCLIIGKPWGEWVVIAGLACLIPFEIASLAMHHTWGRLVVLVINVAVVAYLIHRRLQAHREHKASAGHPLVASKQT